MRLRCALFKLPVPAAHSGFVHPCRPEHLHTGILSTQAEHSRPYRCHHFRQPARFDCNLRIWRTSSSSAVDGNTAAFLRFFQHAPDIINSQASLFIFAYCLQPFHITL